MKKQTQQGSAHVVITICLVLGLLTALGWIYYQNFILEEPAQKETELVVVDKSKNEEEKKNSERKEQTKDANEDYLAIDEWKVKIPLVDNQYDFSITKNPETSMPSSYIVRSSKVADKCKDVGGLRTDGGIGIIFKSSDRRDDYTYIHLEETTVDAVKYSYNRAGSGCVNAVNKAGNEANAYQIAAAESLEKQFKKMTAY